MECDENGCRLTGGDAVMRVLESGPTHATLEWTPRNAEAFQVEMMKEGGEWTVLVENIKNPFLKKKNLVPGEKVYFRVRATMGQKTVVSRPLMLRTSAETQPAAPRCNGIEAQGDGKFAGTLSWDAIPGADVYQVEYRSMSSPDLEWTTISDSLSGLAVRKKNIPACADLIFRVRARRAGGEWGVWSGVSTPVATPGPLSPTFSSLFGQTLLKNNGGKTEQVSAQSLAGKVVLVYFSASWCPPCRQQSQMMKGQYPSIKAKGYPIEIVLVSADRDPESFGQYFGSMPWLAMPWESQRERLMAQYQVNGIPKLMVFSPSGALIADNVAGTPLSDSLVESWLRHK